ncbi:hypothetical protein N0V82_009480 [Gnomoniopsis sp. IMI 355080]|nr:hypothetical protein N0V82_009480 [Gnomoniopsis sp. IMI 355080]
MDQTYTAEPYDVAGRAEDLETLVTDTGARLSYDLILPPDFFPKEPLNVKWVNWRWPRYEYDTTASVSKVSASAQWVVHNGIVLKQLVLENTGQEDVDFEFTFQKDMWIRDLDYLDRSYGFNDSDEGYSYVLGPNGFGYICVHTLEPPVKSQTPGDADVLRSSHGSATEDIGRGLAIDSEAAPFTQHQNIPFDTLTNKSYAVASVITIFVNGKALKTHESGGPHTFTLAGKNSNSTNSTEQQSSTLELIVSYKMILIPDTPIDWRNFLVSRQEADVNDILGRETDSLWETAGDSSLFSIGLSLVDIERDSQQTETKVSTTESTDDSSTKRADQDPKDNKPGSGSAAPNEHTSAHQEMASSKTESQGFPTGTPGKTSPRNHIEYLVIVFVPRLVWFITPRDSNTWQPDDAITDTPFQILKMVEYRRMCNNDDDRKAVDEHLLQIWIPWLLELDKIDRRSMSAWPHAFREGVNIFRLDDHVWVWRALKSLENLGLWKTLPPLTSIRNGKVSGEDPISKCIFQSYGPERDNLNDKVILENFEKIAKRLSPGDVQRNVLQRFTSENDLDVSRKRMLAVTRSPRETRFLLHSRDTSLFYVEELGFFLPESPYHELWENTLAAQLHHDENKETNWDNAIRFARGIVAGSKEAPLNNKDPTELVRICVEVLIRSSSHNGFIPGQLDEATKEPRLFYEEEDVNFYYHAGFEINHILLTYAGRIERFLQKGAKHIPKPGSLQRPATMPSMMDGDKTIHSALAEMLMSLATQPKRQRLNEHQVQQGLGLSLAQFGAATGLDARRNLTMKKLIPFNNLIDVSSINALEDEWLYSYPQFFTREEIDLAKYVDMRVRDSDVLSRDVFGEIIGKELELHRDARDQKKSRWISESKETATFIAETPKKKHLGKREKRALASEYPHCLTNNDLWLKLSVARTVTKAKKRLVWLPHANAETAFLCWVASPESEKPAMSLFFDRHSKYDKHVWDDTTMVMNTWQTELHLSFYKLVDAALPPTLGLPSLSRDPFPGGSKKELRRASMGFRFDGDFFDRYWTCHYIEHIDLETPMRKWVFPFQSFGKHEEKQWWQRKDLELFLLNRILSFATDSSLEILKQIRGELGIGDSTLSFSILDSNAYYVSTQENWQRFEYILQGVDEDLSAVLRTLEKWDRREAERGQEKPRWTRNDERKYRWAINKRQGATEKGMRDLESHRNSIRKLKETLTAKRESIRDDRELRRNENIRYFTYVTVIFLPLGFAASFYSMNGAPPHALTISLVEFAIAAFGVTVGLLASAKAIFGAMKIVLLPLGMLRKQTELALEKSSRNKMDRSLLHGNQDEHLHHVIGTRDQERAPNSPTLHTTRLQTSTSYESTEGPKQVPNPRHGAQDSSTSSAWFWFWPTYVFFEVPGLRILAAIAVLERRTLSPRAAMEVAVGIVSLPIFVVAWVCNLVVLNTRDFVRLLAVTDDVRRSSVSTGPKVPAVSHANADEVLQRRFAKMTRAPRPFKGRERRLEERIMKDSWPPSAQPVRNPVDDTTKE